MKTTLYFIRHGELNNPQQVVYGQKIPLPLSKEGREEIKKLALNFKKRGVVPKIIYSSPLKRTRQSTEEILKVFPETPVIYRKDLQEVDLNWLTGKSLMWVRSLANAYACRGVEKPEKIIQRMMRVIKLILKKHRGQTVFVVSHGDPLSFIFWHLTYPKKPLPSVKQIKQKFLIPKGQAYKIVL